MRCPNCGAEFNQGQFCPNCGFNLGLNYTKSPKQTNYSSKNLFFKLWKIIKVIVLLAILFFVFGVFHTHWLYVNTKFDKKNIVTEGLTYIYEEDTEIIYANITYANVKYLEIRFDTYKIIGDHAYLNENSSFEDLFLRKGVNKNIDEANNVVKATLSHNLVFLNSQKEKWIFRRATTKDVKRYKKLVGESDDNPEEVIDNNISNNTDEITTGESIQETKREDNSGEKYCYRNSETGYEARIVDDCDSIKAEEIVEIGELLKNITKYGNAVLFVAAHHDGGTTEEITRAKYDKYYNPEKDNGVIYTIDYGTDELYLMHCGEFSFWVEEGTGQGIVDDGAEKISESDYASAKIVFQEYYDVLKSIDGQ